MRRALLPGLIGLSLLLGFAQPASAQSREPAIEVRVQSVLTISSYFSYFGKLFGQEEVGNQLQALVQATAESENGLEGIDPNKPAGFYGIITPDVIDSPVVLLVPVANEETLLASIRNKIGLEPKKGKDGVYQVAVPNVPFPVFFVVSDGYLQATVQNAGNLSEKNRIQPKDFFAKHPESLIASTVHLDRLPNDLKKTVLGQFELKINDAKRNTPPNESAAEALLRKWLLDQAVTAANDILTDGKTLSLQFQVNPKTDELRTTVSFSAKSDSKLAKVLSHLDTDTHTIPVLSAQPNPIASLGVHLAIAESQKKKFEKIVEAFLKEAVENAKPEAQGFAKTALDAVAPTLKAGRLDAALLIESRDQKGTPSLALSLNLVKGTGIEKLVKLFAPFAPQDKATFKFDVEKVNGFNLHQATIHEDKLEEKFGTKTVWLAFSDTRLLVSIEPDSTLIRAAAKGIPGKKGVALSEISITRFGSLVEENLPGAAYKEVVAEQFDSKDPSGRDTIHLNVKGGSALTVEFTIKGQAFAFLAKLDQAKKKN